MLDSGSNEIPAKYCDPPILKDVTGKREGCIIDDVLTFELKDAKNLFAYDHPSFRFFYTENDAKCDFGEPTLSEVECDVDNAPHVQIEYVNQTFNEFGINYLGKIIVRHTMKNVECTIRMIGEWTYDPAGVTTSAHASERIGGDCFSMQLGVTVA
jgi:hypothetical protein